jgi:purine-binding chemotaxis protein CheW
MNSELYLYATVGGTAVALPAGQVEAVVRLGEIVPVQCVPAYVQGLAALRSRVLTIIDMQSRICGVPSQTNEAPLAIVVNVAGHAYGLVVTSVSDIAAAPEGEMPLHGRMDEAWTPYATSVVLHEGRSHLLLSVDDFVTVGTCGQLAA